VSIAVEIIAAIFANPYARRSPRIERLLNKSIDTEIV
jgi:hypothetical protein